MKKEVVDAVTEFARAGYSINESMVLAENAIMGANVGIVDLDKVVTYLIAGMRAFNFEAGESARILDVLFTVANATAIDLEGIGEAFLRSANTLKLAGATLEEASALIAGVTYRSLYL
jgi:TP901 family phage tail tape measure protein